MKCKSTVKLKILKFDEYLLFLEMENSYQIVIKNLRNSCFRTARRSRPEVFCKKSVILLHMFFLLILHNFSKQLFYRTSVKIF